MLIIYILIKDKKLLIIKISDLKYFLGTGILSIVCFNFCYFECITEVGGAAVPALLLYTAPIFVMLLSFFLFKEKITVQKVISLIITIIGLGFVTGAFTNSGNLGFKAILLGLGSGFCYALYSIFGKLVVDKYNAITITAYTFIIAAIATVPFCGVIPKIENLINFQGIIAATGLALISTVFAFLSYTKGLSKIEAGKASILATIEPFVAAIVGVFLFHEEFTIDKILGMLLIVFAIILLNLKLKKH